MKHFVGKISGRTQLFMIILMLLGGSFALLLKMMPVFAFASSVRMQTTTPYPTDYPADKQTGEALQRQIQQEAELTPIPSGTVWSFPPATFTPGPTEPPPPSTPAGVGFIIDPDREDSLSKLMTVTVVSSWYADIDGQYISVFAGSDYNDPSQGAIFVAINGSLLPPESGKFLTPDRSGPVHIVGAQGERLILRSDQGKTYYFDVPGRRFTTSLTDSAPSVTPVPRTPTPSLTPTLSGDAPHDPRHVLGLSPVNTPLHHIIRRPNDNQWVRFHLATLGTFQVHLDQLPANYDLYVYRVTGKAVPV